MRIQIENTTAVIIDVQEKLFPHMRDKETLERNINILVAGLRILGVPVIVTEQYTKGLGITIPSLASTMGEFTAIEKSAFSCCDSTEFTGSLQNYKPKFVILAGIEAHVCIQQTGIDLLEKGYTPVVIADCVSSRKESDKRYAIERLNNEGAIITSYESILFELLRYSGTDRFKMISKLVK